MSKALGSFISLRKLRLAVIVSGVLLSTYSLVDILYFFAPIISLIIGTMVWFSLDAIDETKNKIHKVFYALFLLIVLGVDTIVMERGMSKMFAIGHVNPVVNSNNKKIEVWSVLNHRKKLEFNKTQVSKSKAVQDSKKREAEEIGSAIKMQKNIVKESYKAWEKRHSLWMKGNPSRSTGRKVVALKATYDKESKELGRLNSSRNEKMTPSFSREEYKPTQKPVLGSIPRTPVWFYLLSLFINLFILVTTKKTSQEAVSNEDDLLDYKMLTVDCLASFPYNKGDVFTAGSILKDSAYTDKFKETSPSNMGKYLQEMGLVKTGRSYEFSQLLKMSNIRRLA